MVKLTQSETEMVTTAVREMFRSLHNQSCNAESEKDRVALAAIAASWKRLLAKLEAAAG